MKSFLLLAAMAHGVMLPRQAPPLMLNEVAGAKVPLEGYRGEVVVVAFLSTVCTHCQAVSQELERLYVEHGKQGLRVMGLVFNDEGDAAGFQQRFGLLYPVGKTARTTVEQFMGIAAGERIATPQLAFVDRRGVIRAQSEREGSPVLQQPDVMRSLILALLKEER